MVHWKTAQSLQNRSIKDGNQAECSLGNKSTKRHMDMHKGGKATSKQSMKSDNFITSPLAISKSKIRKQHQV